MSAATKTPLIPRTRRFPLRYAHGGFRNPLLKGFHAPQGPRWVDYSGESAEGRMRAKALRAGLRESLGRRATAKEYRAAKRAARKARRG